MTTRRRDLVYRAVVAGFHMIHRLLGLRFVVRGAEHIPASGPAIVASNHLSYLDFTFVGLAGRKRGRFIRFMAKRVVFDNGLSGPLMRAMGHIPVDRRPGAPAAVAYRKAVRALGAGEIVGMFPEGTISRTWSLGSTKLGAATLAVREGVPLVPVVLWAPHRTFTVDRHYSLRRGVTIMVLVGPPVPCAGRTPAEVGELLRAALMDLLHQAWADYPDRPRPGEEWWLPRTS